MAQNFIDYHILKRLVTYRWSTSEIHTKYKIVVTNVAATNMCIVTIVMIGSTNCNRIAVTVVPHVSIIVLTPHINIFNC